QIGTPVELYEDPDNEFVAGFIGSPRMNFFEATMGSSAISFGGIEIPSPALSDMPPPGSRIRIGIRPEHLYEEQGIALPATADVIEQLGSTAYVHARLATGEAIVAEKRRTQMKPGETMRLTFDPANVRYFTSDGQRIR